MVIKYRKKNDLTILTDAQGQWEYCYIYHCSTACTILKLWKNSITEQLLMFTEGEGLQTLATRNSATADKPHNASVQYAMAWLKP